MSEKPIEDPKVNAIPECSVPLKVPQAQNASKDPQVQNKTEAV